MRALPLLAPPATSSASSSKHTEAVVIASRAATAVPSTPPPMTTTSNARASANELVLPSLGQEASRFIDAGAVADDGGQRAHHPGRVRRPPDLAAHGDPRRAGVHGAPDHPQHVLFVVCLRAARYQHRHQAVVDDLAERLRIARVPGLDQIGAL